MRRASRIRGFSMVELLVAMTLSMFVLLGVLAVFSQATTIKTHVHGTLRTQRNVRVAMDKLKRELRMTGFAVPAGVEIGGSASWMPAVFHADQDEIGFRADIDGGAAEIVCTPASSNSDCPLSKLRLDSIRYYENLNCDSPDGATGGLRLVASLDGDRWQPFTCGGYGTSDRSISVAGVTNAVFRAGSSQITTIEQVYYRYVPQATRPYGTVLRYVRYANSPENAFPPTGVTWTTVAENVSDFWLQYQDETGATLSGFPLSASQRAAVRKIVIFLEGYDQVGVDGTPQQIQLRSEVLVRNVPE